LEAAIFERMRNSSLV